MTKQFVLIVPIVLATTIIFPTKAYALSLVPPLLPSELFKVLLSLLLLLIIVLFTTCLIISSLLAKSKKPKSGQKSKFSTLALKVLLTIGALLFISLLSLQVGYIRDLINRNYYILRYFDYPSDTPAIVTEKIIVGFKKGVSQEKAEEYLKSKKVEFTRTEDVNMGKVFLYNTDLKYIVTVQTYGSSIWSSYWIANFNSNPLVYDAAKYSNNPNELID